MTKAEDVHTRSQVEPVRENARPVNRRKLLGEIAGGLVLGHAAVPALAGEAQDPHIAWRAEERRIHDAMVAAFDAGGEERGSELNRQRWEFRSSIIDTPAATLAGLALRVRLVAENEEEGLTLGEDDFTALRSVADDLDRMAGRA